MEHTRLPGRYVRGGRRPRHQALLLPREHHRGNEGLRQDARRPRGHGLSRKAILEQIDASLTRLGTDYIDLYQIHRFDPDTPVEETMEVLHDIVKIGKVRYLGASSMYAWQFAKLQHAADLGVGPASWPCRTSTTFSAARTSVS
jgi:aryl-alcohol dehydrogenase-like predicted oxidoreductase